jgi:3-deoxy-D-manno-octulosonic-acid transferase
MRRIRPTILVLAELELWPNLIKSAKDHGAQIAIANGRMSDHSFPGYRRIRPLVAAVLRQIDLIAAQNDESADRFRALGAPAERVVVTGSLKYDGAQTDRNNARTQSLRQLADIGDSDVVFLAGSTQEPEEQYAIDIFRRLAPTHSRLRLIIVPRHPERFDAVAKLLEASRLRWQRRTQLESRVDGVNQQRPPSVQTTGGSPRLDPSRPLAKVLLVDTVGELGGWWGTAQIAFVGGSFGDRGGQNMIEPAAYGAAVSFGPNTWNFRDIVAALATADAAVVVQNAAQLEAFVSRCLTDRQYAPAIGNRAQQLVESQLGATGRTVALLESLLADRAPGLRREAA